MKRLFKILFIIILGLFTAGVASASLGQFWTTISNIIPRTNDAVDIGSTAKRVRAFFTNDLTFYDEIKPDNDTCGIGEILKKTGADNWDCAADATGAGGSAITFDIGDDGGNDSIDVNEIATTGDTNTIFTEPSADKILIAVSNNWPTSDLATLASTVTVADESADTSCYVGYFTGASGNLAAKTGTNLTFNSSSGVLTATGFSGPLTGDITGNCSGSSGSCTGNAATATSASDVSCAECLILGTEVKAGTLTNDKVCTWDNANSQIICNTPKADVTSVGNCGSGSCLDGSSDGGTQITFYNIDSNWTRLIANNTASDLIVTLPSTSMTIKDWEANSGTIHTGNYVENVSTALSIGTTNANTVSITSDGGADDVTIPAAVNGTAGLLTDAKWDEIVANTAKTTNATHTGDVTGATALTIGNDRVLESHLKAVNSPTDEYVLTYEATTGDFEWEVDQTGGNTAWDDIGNPDAADEIDFASYITELNVADFRIGDGGSNYVKFNGAGLITFVGTGDIDLPNNSVDSGDVNFNYAASASEAGAATGLSCTDCVQAAEIETINCGTNCTWDATNDEIDIDDAFMINSGSDIAGTGSGFTWGFNASAGSDPAITFGDGIINVSAGVFEVGGVEVQTGEDLVADDIASCTHVNNCTLTADVITDNLILLADFAHSQDYGDFTIGAGESFTLDTNSVSDNEINYSEVTLADFDYQTAWRLFYSNAAGDVTELALGADNTYLMSNGAAVAPTFESIAGGGDITDVFSCSTGDCSSITMAATDLLNMSGVDASATNEGLILPQHATACAGGTAEGQVCWEADANILHIGDGAAIKDFVPTSAFSGEATVGTTGVVTIADSVAVTSWSLTTPTITTSIDLPAGAINTATEIAADIITHTQIADADQTITVCMYIEDPVAADDLKSIWANKTANNFLFTEIWGESDQTVSFDLQVDDGSPADVSGTDIAPAAGEAEDTTLAGDTTLAAGEELDLIITSVTNTPTWVSICWTGNWID